MLRRLVGLILFAGLILAGLYYWKVELGGRTPRSVGEVGQEVRDATVTASVKTALGLNRSLEAYSIDVATRRGVVTLKGSVPSGEVKALAATVVRAVPDVREVVDELRVEPGTVAASQAVDRSVGERVDDGAVEVRVRLALSLKRDLKGTDIQVSAFKRAVTLSGRVQTRDQRRLAEETAKATLGVSSVTDELRAPGEDAGVGDRHAVERAVEGNRNLAHYEIQVLEEGGRIVLKGAVHTPAEKDLAGLLAERAARGPVQNSLELK